MRRMRYSDEIVEEVRQRNDIVDVIGGYVRLQKKGSNYFGLCPFHNEKSPSFSVSGIKQMYYCFGCGKGGNVITFLMDYENETFSEAIVRLAERAGIALPEQPSEGESKKENEYRAVLLEIQKEAAKYYFYQLKSDHGKIGYKYLKDRGLSDETILKFGLGYAPAYPNALYRYLRQKGYTDTQLKDSGLVRIEERGAYDKFWNRVMFPIMDINNKVIGFGGRVMGEGTPKYLNSPETPIFDKSRNLYGLNTARRTKKPYLLVCEGYMDVISLHQAGFTNAVAALGTAFTVQHGLLIKRYTKEVVLTFDSDGAGIKAALRAIPLVREAGLSARVLTMEPFKDPDEFIKKRGAEAYQERIDQAMNAFMFEVKILRKEYDFSDPAKRTAFIDEVSGMLRQFQDELEQDSYIQAVARDYAIDYGMLRSRVRSSAAVPFRPAVQEPAQAKGKKREKDEGIRAAQRMVLTWLAEHPQAYERVADVISVGDFTDSLYRKAAEYLFAQLEKGQVSPAEILTHFIGDEGEYQEIARVFHTGLKKGATEEDRDRAVKECILRVRKNSLEEEAKNAQDFEQLQKVIQEQKALEQLNIYLN